MDAKLKAGLLAAVAVAAVVALGLGLLNDDGDAVDVGPRLPNSTDSPPPPDAPDGTSTPDRPTNGTVPETPTGGTAPLAPDSPTDTRPPTQPRPDDPKAPVGSASAVFQCLDGKGEPLSNVRIEARRASGAPLTPVVTDGSGEARLPGLVAGERIQGVARHPTSRDAARFGPAPVGESVIVLRFRPSAQGTLRGTLRDDTGQPVTQAELVLVNPKSPEGEAVLDPISMGLRSDGSFIATVAVGTYTVWARAEGLSESDRTYITVAPGRSAPVSIVLNRQGNLSGQVRLPGDLASNPVQSMELVWECKTGTAENPYTRTGRETLDVTATVYSLPNCDPGRYRLRLEAILSDGTTRVGNWGLVNVQAGENVPGVTLTLTESVVAIQGTVKDDLGTPLAGVTVRIGAQRGLSRDDGAYVLRGLDMGEFFLEAKLEGHAPGFQQVNYRAQRLTIDLVLPRNGGVRGEVRGADGPAPFTLVLVVQEEEDGVRTHETKTDGQGYYQLEGLSPGPYTVKAGPGADPFTSGGAKVTIAPGEIAEAPAVGLE